MAKKQAKEQVIEQAGLNFEALVGALITVDSQIRVQTSKAINMSLTARNWLFGQYIVVYEQNGSDRAAYGAQLIDKLADRLKVAGLGFEPRTLRLFRQFTITYPQIGNALAKLPQPGTQIWQPLIAKLSASGNELLEKLSFTALAELIQIDDPLKRAFYEQEAIRGNWSVRELRRQIATLLYERTGLCTKKSNSHKSVVEYALAGMDNQLFVSRYAVELPKKEDMERALAQWITE